MKSEISEEDSNDYSMSDHGFGDANTDISDSLKEETKIKELLQQDPLFNGGDNYVF